MRSIVWIFIILFSGVLSAQDAEKVWLNEEGLSLTLFAEDPDIVTPVGLAVGPQDEVYVIESHTHARPSDYVGPESDRIKVFKDEDGDGVADSIAVFAEGFIGAMNLAFSKDGVLYVLCAWTLYALPDRDGDGVCDGPELILTLETKGTNYHGCWLGITFDDDNFMYLSRGNVGGEYWRVEGPDGSIIEGFGDGGNVMRARPDGSELQEWATGFWNSMDLKFDHRGNLLLVDNDPDARGPNRLLRVVEGGDYGHKHMFGGAGRHPFQGWDASFPGHLPFISGTGEAPSGLIDVSAPGEHSLLITIWNENTIERHEILQDGQVKKSIFMEGGKNFRPVALGQDSGGNLYISDWMLVDYPVHGKGRIWRVSKLPIPKKRPGRSELLPDRYTVTDFLRSDDLFQRHAGELWLSKEGDTQLFDLLMNSRDSHLRLGAYLALRRKGVFEQKLIERALGDEDRNVRRLALLWASEALNVSLRPALDRVFQSGPVDAVLFNAYLAAVEMVNPTFIEAYRSREITKSTKLPRPMEAGLIKRLASDQNLSPAVRAQAIRRLEPSEALSYLESEEESVLAATIERVSSLQEGSVADRLMELALDEQRSSSLRCEALWGLSKQIVEKPDRLLGLLNYNDPDLVYETARTLRFHTGNPAVRKAFETLVAQPPASGHKDALAELAETALHGMAPGRPKSVDDWIQRLATGGDPVRGSRVFRSTQAMCTQCHTINAEGTNLGPDLGGIAGSVTRSQIIHSILRPSALFPPQYQAWNVYTTDGRIHTGLQIDHLRRGAMLLYTLENVNRRFEAEEVKNYEASPYSLMPQGLENALTVSEFNDLVAYLSSLK